MPEKQDWKFYVNGTVQSILLWAAFFQCLDELRRNSCLEFTDCLKIFFLWCKLISKEFCKGESYFWLFLEVMLWDVSKNFLLKLESSLENKPKYVNCTKDVIC